MAQLRRIVVNSISGSEQPEAKKARLQRTEKNPYRTFSARHLKFPIISSNGFATPFKGEDTAVFQFTMLA
jgi:hypothetical protein